MNVCVFITVLFITILVFFLPLSPVESGLRGEGHFISTSSFNIKLYFIFNCILHLETISKLTD